MASVRDYFEQNFPQALTVDVTLAAVVPLGEHPFAARTHMDFDAMATYASVLLPQVTEEETIALTRTLFRNPTIVLQPHGNVALPRMGRHHAGAHLTIETTNPMKIALTSPDGTSVRSDQLIFTQRLYLYTEAELPESLRDQVLSDAQACGLTVSIRGPNFVQHVEAVAQSKAFISHDSRDKEEIARPLAIGLGQRLCRVWYDEFSLHVGDSLRESIEDGLKTHRHCILVLTPNFLSKGGWPRQEYDAAFTRELMEKRKILLPIWHNVLQEDVFAYSPMLANRLGLSWSLGADEVCRRLYNELTGADA